jgi:N-methylhydantoinase B
LSRPILPSVEEWESAKNVRITSLEFAADTCGHGQWRGAPAVEALIELPRDYLYTICVQGVDFGPAGVLGGTAGAPAAALQHGSTEATSVPLPRVAVETALQGVALRLRGRGGAGFGNPKDRSPEAVLADVLDGLVSPETAKDVYGTAVEAKADHEPKTDRARRNA